MPERYALTVLGETGRPVLELTRRQEYDMKADKDWTDGTGGNFSARQNDRKDTTALLYLDLVDDARAWSASASAMAWSRSFREWDDMATV